MGVLELHDALGVAYGLDQLHADEPAAITHLRTVLAHDQIRCAAESELTRLSQVVAVRGQGCHVSNVSLRLLQKALSEEKAL